MKIGIITGAGAYTGAIFYNKLINEIVKLPHIKNDEDFPYIQLINYPFKCLSNKGVEDEKFLEIELENCFSTVNDCDIVFVLCFSFHKILKKLSLTNFKGKIIFLNDIKSVKNSLILCSESSKNCQLFGVKGKYIEDENYDKLNNVIKKIIFGKTKSKKFDKFLKNYLKKNNFKKIFLGCTELFCYDFSKSLKKINPEKKLIKICLKEIKNEILSRKSQI